MSKLFIAITTRIVNNKLVLVTTNKGYSVYNENGLTFDAVIDFLYELRKLKTANTVFAFYAFSLDNEFIFSSLSKETKDKLFQSSGYRKQLAELEKETLDLQAEFYSKAIEADRKEVIDFDLYVNKLAKIDLNEIKHRNYKIKLINGKFLTITKNKRSITFYDIYGFFRKPLIETVKTWLHQDINIITDTNDLELYKANASKECKYIALLGEKLTKELSNVGINLRSFYGASAIASWLLSKSKAKNEFHNYNNPRTLAPELNKAVMQAFYAGRGEQFKLGTFNNINVYDINSAYAYAILDLPVLLRKPVFTTDFQTNPFSVWYCEFDFTSLSDCLYFGYLPTRNKRTNHTGFYSSGKGYYWYSEIRFVLDNFPDCIKVKHGFVLPEYTKAEFTLAVNALYNTRKQLQAEKNPLEKVIKIGLSSLYGKFCQHNGKGFYNNFFYAGFITSHTRAMLLEATKGFEKETICFLTDAIHTTANLPLPLNDDIGSYKLTTGENASYLDNGIYRYWNVEKQAIKTATKGYKIFDFDKAIRELNEKQFFEAEQKLFIGHNLNTLNPVTFKDYLSVFAFEKHESALTDKFFKMREFGNKIVDLSETFIDSKILAGKAQESGLYKPNEFKDSDAVIDSLIAGKI